MLITRKFFKSHHLDLSETKSKVMTYNASTDRISFSGFGSLTQMFLESVLSFKYLGIHLSCSPYNLFKSFNDHVRTKARNYLQSVLSLCRNSSNVVSNLDAGLKPVLFHIAEKVLIYSSNLMKKPDSYWPKKALTENLNLGSRSPYTTYLI